MKKLFIASVILLSAISANAANVKKAKVCIFIPVEVHYSKTNISHQAIKACAPYGTPTPKKVKKIIIKKVG